MKFTVKEIRVFRVEAESKDEAISKVQNNDGEYIGSDYKVGN